MSLVVHDIPITNNLETHKFMVHKRKYDEHGLVNILCETAQMFDFYIN